jgi:hypothetical protein
MLDLRPESAIHAQGTKLSYFSKYRILLSRLASEVYYIMDIYQPKAYRKKMTTIESEQPTQRKKGRWGFGGA